MIRLFFHKTVIRPSADRADVKAVPILEDVFTAYRTRMRFFGWTVCVRIIICGILGDHGLEPLSVLTDALHVSTRFKIRIGSLGKIISPTASRALKVGDIVSLLQFGKIKPAANRTFHRLIWFSLHPFVPAFTSVTRCRASPPSGAFDSDRRAGGPALALTFLCFRAYTENVSEQTN